MSIHINQAVCIGCKKCAEVCPGNLIEVEQKKAVIVYEKDCWGCASCVKECPVGAISLYLGADIGGRGASLHIKMQQDLVKWEIKKEGKIIEQITIDPKDSNKY